MKKIFMTLIAAMTLSVAMAQPDCYKQNDGRGERHAPTAEMMTSRMVEHLGLDNVQAKKLAKLNKKYEKLITAGPMKPRRHCDAKSDCKPQPDGMTGATMQNGKCPDRNDGMKREMGKRRAKYKEYDGELEKILTAEQFAKFRELRKTHRSGCDAEGKPDADCNGYGDCARR